LNITDLASVEYVDLRVDNLQTKVVSLQTQISDLTGTINTPYPARANFAYGT
jgi:chaperonin cofactor prefoldin